MGTDDRLQARDPQQIEAQELSNWLSDDAVDEATDVLASRLENPDVHAWRLIHFVVEFFS